MGGQIPGALGDPFPAPALTDNSWPAIGTGHQLVYLGADWVLDWVPASGNFIVWRIDRNPAAGANPLTTAVCFHHWATIDNDHRLLYLGGDRLLDWNTSTNRFRVWLINRAATGDADCIPGVPQTDGLWSDINNNHQLVRVSDDRVLDWHPGNGQFRIRRHDASAVGAANPLPDTVAQGQFATFRSKHEIVAVGRDRVLAWHTDTGAFQVLRYDRTNPADPFPGEPEVVGHWTTIRAPRALLHVDGDRVLDWHTSNGHYRLWRYDPNVTTLRRATVKLHVRVLTAPRSLGVPDMVRNAKNVYANYGIDLQLISNETLPVENTPNADLQTLDIGECRRSQGATEHQKRLFGLRGAAGKHEIVVYVVRETSPQVAGCATHPVDQPGATISSKEAGQWTLAHEIGHVLGLDDAPGSAVARVMRMPTERVDSPQPGLTADELLKVLASPLCVK